MGLSCVLLARCGIGVTKSGPSHHHRAWPTLVPHAVVQLLLLLACELSVYLANTSSIASDLDQRYLQSSWRVQKRAPHSLLLGDKMIRVLLFAAVALGVATGTATASADAVPIGGLATSPFLTCGGGSYQNSDGNCVSDPTAPIPDANVPCSATAICRDGDDSYSQHHSGTCSGHGGVSQWLIPTC